MKHSIKFLIVSLLMVGAGSVSAATVSWDLNTAGEYAVSDADSMEVADGVAKLKGSIGTLNPQLRSFYDSITPYFIELSNDEDIIYVADGNGITTLDISDLDSPTYLDNISVYANTSTFDVSSDDAYALVGTAGRNSEIGIFNVSNPADIVDVDVLLLSSQGNIFSPDGNTMYVSSGGIYVYDVSDIETSTPQIGYTNLVSADALAISSDGNTLYGIDSGIEILDVSDPANISSIGNFNPLGSLYSNITLSVDGNTAYISQGANGIEILDVSDPANISSIGSYDTVGSARSITVSADEEMLFVADDSNGVVILDITDPTTPTLLTTYSVDGAVSKVILSSDETRMFINDTYNRVEIVELYPLSYPSSSPYLIPTNGQVFSSTLDSFSETLGLNNEGSVTYQVSNNNGTTWYFWDGDWYTTTVTDGTETTAASDINTNIATLDTDGGEFLWRAYLNSNGTEQVELDEVTIDGIFTLPPESEEDEDRSSTRKSSRRLSQAQVDELFSKTSSSPEPDTATPKQCDNPLTQNLKAPSRNGVYNSYTGGIVTEAKILQSHLNRLGFQSGPEDGIIGPLTDGAIKRMQISLNVTPDGYVGPITRAAINNSCTSYSITELEAMIQDLEDQMNLL